MGILKKFFKSKGEVQQLPQGTLTVSRDGEVLTSTVGSAYSPSLLRDIARNVLELFRQAREAQMPLTEVSIHFASLHVTAHELRGGALIFLLPQSALSQELKQSRP